MLTDDDLIISPDKTEILIKIQAKKSEIKAVEISQLIGRAELAQLFRLDDNIIKAADLINLATQEQALDPDSKTNTSETPSMVIARKVNAEIEIEFSQDEMKAYAIITAPYAGTPVDISDLMIILSQHNLTQSLHEEGLEEFLEMANTAEPGTKSTYHVLS